MSRTGGVWRLKAACELDINYRLTGEDNSVEPQSPRTGTEQSMADVLGRAAIRWPCRGTTTDSEDNLVGRRNQPHRRGLAAFLTLLVVLAPTSVAEATNFGSQGTAGVSGTTNGVWLTNNYVFIVAKRALTAKYSQGVSDALNQEFNPTDLSVTIYVASSCVDDDHDTCVYDSNYGDNGLNGWNSCWGGTIGGHPNQICTVTWVRINEFFNPPAKRIACHEIAHSVGLRHTQEQASCVKRTADGGNSEVLSSHDKSHINAQY